MSLKHCAGCFLQGMLYKALHSFCIIALVFLVCTELHIVACAEYVGNSPVTVRYQTSSVPGLFFGLADYGDHRPKQTILDKSGKLNPAFTCNNVSDIGCFTVDMFQDRSVFYFEFQASYNYYPRNPKIESKRISVLVQQEVTLEAEDLLDDGRRGYFTIAYDCPRQATVPSSHLVKMVVPLGQPSTELSFSFLKECGCGTHPYAYLVLQDEQGEEMNEKVPVLDKVSSTFQLSLILNHAEAVQSFGIPDLIYDHSSYKLRMYGQDADRGGIALGGEKITWILQDECIASQNGIPRQANIYVPIPPFEPLSIQFSKDCGGGRPQGLYIGSNPSSFDIMKDGIVLNSPIITLNKTDKVLQLYLSLHGESSPHSMFVGSPIFDILDTSLVYTKLISDTPTKKSLALHEDLLRAGEQKLYTFSFVCKRTGQTTIDITFPVRYRDNINLRLIKRCKAPLAFNNSPFPTANTTLILITLFAFVFGICAVKKLRHQKN